MDLKHRTIAVDTHTHTVLSGHAWSTLRENCAQAAKVGLKKICSTEHGPAMEGAPPWFYACSHKMLPEELYGIGIVPGIEFNIIDFEGNVDNTHSEALAQIHFGIASMHDVTMPLGTKAQHTQAYINALEKPYVDILGHPGYAYFPNDPQEIVLAAKRLNKLIEINNNSFRSRANSKENCVKFAQYCKQYEVRVCVSSDAHFDLMIGQVPIAMEMLDEVGFPPELILNLDCRTFDQYLAERETRVQNYLTNI